MITDWPVVRYSHWSDLGDPLTVGFLLCLRLEGSQPMALVLCSKFKGYSYRSTLYSFSNIRRDYIILTEFRKANLPTKGYIQPKDIPLSRKPAGKMDSILLQPCAKWA